MMKVERLRIGIIGFHCDSNSQFSLEFRFLPAEMMNLLETEQSFEFDGREVFFVIYKTFPEL